MKKIKIFRFIETELTTLKFNEQFLFYIFNRFNKRQKKAIKQVLKYYLLTSKKATFLIIYNENRLESVCN